MCNRSQILNAWKALFFFFFNIYISSLSTSTKILGFLRIYLKTPQFVFLLYLFYHVLHAFFILSKGDLKVRESVECSLFLRTGRPMFIFQNSLYHLSSVTLLLSLFPHIHIHLFHNWVSGSVFVFCCFMQHFRKFILSIFGRFHPKSSSTICPNF